MKITIHTSMHWMQNQRRHLTSMDNHDNGGRPPLSSLLPQSPSESKSTITEADRPGLIETSNVV